MTSMLTRIRRRQGWLELNNARLQKYNHLLVIATKMARSKYFEGAHNISLEALYNSACRTYRHRSMKNNTKDLNMNNHTYRVFCIDIVRIFNYWGMLEIHSDSKYMYFKPYYPESIQFYT